MESSLGCSSELARSVGSILSWGTRAADLENLECVGLSTADRGKLPVLLGLHFGGPKHRLPLVVIILASPALIVRY